MKRLLCLSMFIPFLVSAQDDKGIHFETGLNWQQVLAKAKTEGKYIFVDCFATWCGPCKAMDKSVYPSEKVGGYVNDKFISVKVQMDSSRQDDEQTKSWYAAAHLLMKEYKIMAFPSYLFFSPDGKAVHRDFGFKSKDDFIVLTGDALNRDKQYYPLLDAYQQGKKNYAAMPYLARITKRFGDKELADSITQDYLHSYLYKLSDEELYTKENIGSMASALRSSKERAFDLFYHNADRVDKIMGFNGYAQTFVDYIIAKEEIDPNFIRNNIEVKDPEWDKISHNIKEKYNTIYAERTVLNAQIRWYTYRKDWPEAVKYNIEKVEKYGMDTAGIKYVSFNNLLFDVIFEHSDNKKVLEKALGWAKTILDGHPRDFDLMDTYANLLYKLGRKEEALAWEEKAVLLSPREKEIQDNYEKMKKGEPTWASLK